MANLNRFKNVSANLTTSNTTFYTAPTGYTAIILLAQVSNISADVANATFGWSNTSIGTELISGFPIPVNDAANLLLGKLVLQNAHSVYAKASANNKLKMTLSVLESLN